ncbi:M14 family metallopeptidase [Marivirga sp. S37H4]|uniref:M14 family metallopeptidase n=1 Tax=Marivirga aurantiaca TaxID=2802615 RepID=A0A935CD98_9BACT|nr:M14 family metallopeptidase [Marivirga aurantiaca]MBK6266698.1 M14 family metallopeptidase [Marivirga aurantiaca]
MKCFKLSLYLLLAGLSLKAQEFQTPFEQSNGTETATYEQGIHYYQSLAEAFPQIRMMEMGLTDSGEPLHLVIFNKTQNFNLAEIKNGEKAVFLINNAIHAGEPDGVDASMMLLRDLAQNEEDNPFLDDVVIAVIPFYNVGGVLNRNNVWRVNQNGPESYGFRGNAKNLDLNRDFIKMDSKNAFSFIEIFHSLDPDIFVDTHVTNGSDHQHVLTILSTQHNKLGGGLGKYLENTLEPLIFEEMIKKGNDPVPYVNVHGKSPEEGWTQFWDAARYTSGYSTLFQTIGFMTESHMWKDYEQRVEANYDFLLTIAQLSGSQKEQIKSLRSEAKEKLLQADSLPVLWKNNKNEFKMITLKGYRTSMPESELTGQPLLKYHRDDPFEKEVPFFNEYVVSKEVRVPDYYILPQAWHNLKERLEANGVKMEVLNIDTTINVQSYRIKDYQTVRNVYESHYLHYNTQVDVDTISMNFRKGDYIIPLNQLAKRYLVETLEPEAQDSFFNWNFFDSILQQKEGFSDYVFEEKAKSILNEFSEEQQKEFQQLKEEDSTFAQSNYAQLDWIFKRSAHYEKAHLRYPVYRLFK